MRSGTFALQMYVDVILPLALPGLLTYAVPAGDENAVQEGCRIIVPLRGKRLHTAVVRRVHNNKPEHATEPYSVGFGRPSPSFSETLKFWDWIAAHYCCGPGEVALAALPSGMRLASETKLELSPDVEDRDEEELERQGVSSRRSLRLRGGLSFKEVGILLGVVESRSLASPIGRVGLGASRWRSSRRAHAEKQSPWSGCRSKRALMSVGSTKPWMPWMPRALPVPCHDGPSRRGERRLGCPWSASPKWKGSLLRCSRG